MSGQPPSSPQDRAGRGRSHSPDTRPDDVDENQLHQDIDAARQMSRARAGSVNLHLHHPQHLPPGATAAPSGAGGPTSSPTLIPGSDNSNGRRPSQMPMAESVRRQTDQMNGGNLQTPMHPDTYYAGHSPSARNNNASFQASSPLQSYSVAQQQQQMHPAARFYMQHHRQGSNSSLDSASHFIDHRSQQLPPPAAMSPGARLSGTGRRSQGRLEPITSSDSSYQRRRKVSNMDTSAVDEEPMGMHVDDIRAAASHQDRATATDPASNAGGGRSNQARGRLIDLGAEDADDENAPEESLRAGTPNTMSRRNSMLQDDVCFPMMTPAEPPGVDAGMARGVSSQYEHQMMHEGDDGMQHHHHEEEHVNLPPGYPWTFDLNSLEEYANQEKKRIEEESHAAANVAAGWGLRNRSAANARDVKRRSVSDRRSMPGTYGISPDSDDATFYSRRPRKLINIPGMGSEADIAQNNSASGRYQRKLALFEGAGSAPPPVGARASTHAGTTSSGGGIFGGGALMNEERDRHRTQAAQTANGYPADTKTPLLEGGNDTGLPSYQGTDEPVLNRSVSVGADLSNLSKNRKSKRPGRGARAGSYNNDRQYRFTFYSNALANTIHARHLHELPAAGQSFEELFMGLEPGGYKREDNGQTNTTPPAADIQVGSSQEKEKSPANRPVSGLASALQQQSGRVESNTAPPTGSNTPEIVTPHALPPVRPQNAAQARLTNSNMPASARNSTMGNAGMAANEKARAMPGGGIRMDQDPEMCTWWLDVLCPTDQEMKMLSRVFGIHPLTTEDILMEETREKIELFRNYYLVCFRSFDQDPYSPTYLEPLNMYVIVFREGTLSFHFRATPHPQNVRRRIKQLKDYINVTSDWISYALIDDITDAFGPLIQSIEYEVDSIDELVLILKEAEQSDMLRRIGTCRKKVMGLLRLMGNKADVVKGLAKRCNENWSVAPKSDIGLYLSDIQDHLITMTQNLNHYEKILSRSHSNYLAQISIEMTDANNQINDVLSKLTALGTVIVPLNVITGLWGMNVNVPGQGVENLHWFFSIVAVMIALAVVGYFAAIRYLSR